MAEVAGDTKLVITCEKSHCPTCGREQNCDLHGRVYRPWEYSDRSGNSTSGGVTHSLFECRGCNTVFYETSAWDENDYDQWYDHWGKEQQQANLTKATFPRPSLRERPNWIEKEGKLDAELRRILEETYGAIEAGSLTLSLIGLRSTLDRCFALLDIDPAMTYVEKITALQVGHYIGKSEYDSLTVLVNAGNAAAHQGWRAEQDQVARLLDVLENFVQRVIVNGRQAVEIGADIPARQARRPKGLGPQETGASSLASEDRGAPYSAGGVPSPPTEAAK
ncbi:hypothetical protein C8J46_105427 [Sphingomonas sp. PP-F2F-A104-K0414]|uniref:DUF4145 domain-containing protein n=1 Tax=Sphingomonas sp. PP-F2F-A104-K0414 TaxID=2135661 RepID=UPI001053C7A3|nr:DUF4145 domain-containing protein [Sphingomonas sp. PP-F2F-A104-K0414]TCP98272.1 hypothetical protein C8J46_105427 [Sphingomonas sp. PP-F2F-A104-K0414]